MSGVTVIGIGADGWESLGEQARRAVLGAGVVIGGERHLALLPTQVPGRRVPLPRPLREGLPELLTGAGDAPVAVLASGDPLVHGIGATLVDLLGTERVRVLPHLSSVALARARMAWSAPTTSVCSLTTAGVDELRPHLHPGARVVVLAADDRSPAAVAALLREAGAGDAVLDLWSHLGSADESHHRLRADDPVPPVPALTVICVTCPPRPIGPARVPGLDDALLEHDGQLTKRDLRASALARLAPHPGELLWDVGAGAGSVGIEWMRTHPRCRALAVEADPQRAQRISRNAARLGVPRLQVVTGSAPEALAGLPAPDAVFVGGGLTHPGLLDAVLAATGPGARVVAHAVTLQAEQVLLAARARHGGELTRISVERAEPLGSLTGWRPARAVTQWSVSR